MADTNTDLRREVDLRPRHPGETAEDVDKRENDRRKASMYDAGSNRPGPKIDGTHEMTKDEQRDAGIVDDAGRKIVPGTAFLLVAGLFMGVTIAAFLVWLLVSYLQQPEFRP